MTEIGKRLLVFIIGNLVLFGVSSAITNKMDGKDIFGRPGKKKDKKETRVDWRGNVILGTADYKVA